MGISFKYCMRGELIDLGNAVRLDLPRRPTRGEDSSAGPEIELSSPGSNDTHSLYERPVPVPVPAHTNADVGPDVSEDDHTAGFVIPNIGSMFEMTSNSLYSFTLRSTFW